MPKLSCADEQREQEAVDAFRKLIRSVKFGTVSAIIQNGKLLDFEVNARYRLDELAAEKAA